MKGILMAGGRGTRLFPMTKSFSKHLLPVYDKPLIYYPLSILLLAGIRDILIVTAPEDLESYRKLLGDGQQIGVRFTYVLQPAPNGPGEAFLLGEEFLGGEPVLAVLGDNVFFGSMSHLLERAKEKLSGAVIFGYEVAEPGEFGIVELSSTGRVLSLEEKPQRPKSGLAVPGLYFYDGRVSSLVKNLAPSFRGELEITDVNREYLNRGELRCERMGRGTVWLDAGTPKNLLRAAQFVEAVQKRQGYYVAAIEEIAWRKGFISTSRLRDLGLEMGRTEYGQYLISLTG